MYFRDFSHHVSLMQAHWCKFSEGLFKILRVKYLFSVMLCLLNADLLHSFGLFHAANDLYLLGTPGSGHVSESSFYLVLFHSKTHDCVKLGHWFKMKEARSLGTAQELKKKGSRTLVNLTPVLERSAAMKAEKRNSTRAFLFFFISSNAP